MIESVSITPNFGKYARHISTLVIIILLFISQTCSLIRAQTETVTILSNQQMDTNTVFMTGFINGGASYNIPLTQKLKPAVWGFGWDAAADYDYAVPNFNLSKMASIYSAYMNYFGIGDPLLLQPWTGGWVQWDTFVENMINQSISTSRPVDFWSVFGEPDATFSGTTTQYIEMFRRTDSILKSVDPVAKLVGPDFIDFGIGELLYFVDSLDDLGVHPEAISWHEFGNNPEIIYSHVQQMKDSLAVRPLSGNPEIHIQEYGDPNNRLIPGWAVGWLYYFEKSKINWASRGCFNEFDGVNTWDDCWDGLSGMYMMDGVTTQPLYWLHRAYAELNETGRVITTANQPRTVAMASKNDGNNEMKIIVGRHYSIYQGTPDPVANVEIKIRNYPYGNNSTQPLIIQKIPAQTVAYTTPLANPITTFSGSITFVADSATVTINNFADGDAYIVYINPDLSTILSTEETSAVFNNEAVGLEVYPNPTNETVVISTSNANNSNIFIYDVTGKIIYQNSTKIGEHIIVSTNEFANGLYIVRMISNCGISKTTKLVVKH